MLLATSSLDLPTDKFGAVVFEPSRSRVMMAMGSTDSVVLPDLEGEGLCRTVCSTLWALMEGGTC